MPALEEAAVIKTTRERLKNLLKPPGALGRAEDLVTALAGIQGTARPAINRPACVTFVGNHGVTRKGVSAYPADITLRLVDFFKDGKAAINQICRMNAIDFSCVTLFDGRFTEDISEGPAMTVAAFKEAFAIGQNAVPEGCDLFIAGDAGIGNTTAATAIACALLKQAPKTLTGGGAGLDDKGIQLKREIITQALRVNAVESLSPLEILRKVGGFELVAIAGSAVAARERRIPFIADGVIATAALLALHTHRPALTEHVIAGHLSAEPAHRHMLAYLKKEPILDLSMRLGEGTGAALSVSILRHALNLYDNMATFSDL